MQDNEAWQITEGPSDIGISGYVKGEFAVFNMPIDAKEGLDEVSIIDEIEEDDIQSAASSDDSSDMLPSVRLAQDQRRSPQQVHFADEILNTSSSRGRPNRRTSPTRGLLDEFEYPKRTISGQLKARLQSVRRAVVSRTRSQPLASHQHAPARAYQFGNTIIIEDEDGEVIKQYEIPAPEDTQSSNTGVTRQKLQQIWKGLGRGNKEASVEAGTRRTSDGSSPDLTTEPVDQLQELEEVEDDRLIFRLPDDRRLSRAQFIQELANMDPKARVEVVEDSDLPESMKQEAGK